MIFIIIIIIYKVPPKMSKPSEKCKKCPRTVCYDDLCYKHALKFWQTSVKKQNQLDAQISHWRSLIGSLIKTSFSETNPESMKKQHSEIESYQEKLDEALTVTHAIIKPKREPKDGNHYWYHTSNPFHRGNTNSGPSNISNARALYREVLDASCDSPDVIYGFDELVKLDTILIIPGYIPRQSTKQNKK
jgi:hypothetical protein